MNHLRWLYPGIGVKRWAAVTALGIVLFGGGFTSFVWRLLQDKFDSPFVRFTTLQFIPYPLRGYLFVLLGLLLLLLGLFKLYKAVLSPFLGALRNRPLVEHIWLKSKGTLGPNIVVLGGGKEFHGLLRGLKPYTSNLVAIIPAPTCAIQRDGKVVGEPADSEEPVQCLLSLADAEQEMSKLFDTRIRGCDGDSLESFGRLFWRAVATTAQDPVAGIRQVGSVLAVGGQLIPATAETLTVRVDSLESDAPARELSRQGPSLQQQGWTGLQVSIYPPAPTVVPEALMAILDADLLVVGPGSVAAHILPLFLIEPVSNAIAISSAVKIFVCGEGDEPGGLRRLGALDQLQTLAGLSKRLPFHFAVVKDQRNSLEPKNIPWEGGKNGLPAPIYLAGGTGDDGPRLALQLMRTYFKVAGRWARGRMS